MEKTDKAGLLCSDSDSDPSARHLNLTVCEAGSLVNMLFAVDVFKFQRLYYVCCLTAPGSVHHSDHCSPASCKFSGTKTFTET